MIRKIMSFGLLVIMAFSLTACGNSNGLRKQLDDLQKKIEQQDDKIADLENEKKLLADKIKELEDSGQDYADEIAKLKRKLQRMEDITGIVIDSWEGSDIIGTHWYHQVEVDIEFPRTVMQGEPFVVKVTTTNISDEIVEYISNYTCGNKGVFIYVTCLFDEIGYSISWKGYGGMMREDLFETRIQPGAKIEHVWEFDGGIMFAQGLAPKGVYDIYLSNGEVIKNAIEMV